LGSAAQAKPAPDLSSIMQIDEPGAQMRALETWAQTHPKAPEPAQIYNAILQDATQLNDDRTVLRYNEKLQDLDPGDLSQRVKTLNLLLLETDAASRKLALEQAQEFSKMVEAKAAEAPPKEIGPVRWRFDLARLRSLAALLQGTAEQALGQYAAADQDLNRSLQQSETEEAAEHLASVYVAEGKIPQAVQAYAMALALPGSTIAGRAALRKTAGDLYAQQHQGSQQGFGDLILRQFDQAAERDANEQAELNPRAARNASAASAGDFVLTALEGGAPHKLSEDRGKVIVLDFWATWCGPCRVQHPLIAALKKEFANNHDVIFLAVNEDEDQAKVAPFLTQQGWDRSTLLDAGLGPFLGVNSLPTTLILSPSGTVVYRAEGFVPETFQAELRSAIERALAARAAAPSQ